MIAEEIWKPIVGYEGAYEISSLGRVKSLSRILPLNRFGGTCRHIKERIIKQIADKFGYCRVGLFKDKKAKILPVHRLVAFAFLENPDNKETVNHKNGNPSDNSLMNLEWSTYKENIQHSFNVLKRKGAAQGRIKEKCWLFGRKGSSHPCYGNKHLVGRTGKLSVRSKAVKCTTFDIDFESGRIAAQSLGIPEASVNSVCRGRFKQTHGLVFRFINL